MSKLLAFVRLDLGTIKPYVTPFNMTVFAVLAAFLSVAGGNISMSLGIGFMLATLFCAYPFAIGEMHNLDALYRTLRVNQTTVVAGRYLYVLLLNILCILFCVLCSACGIFGAKALGLFQGGSHYLLEILMVSGFLCFIQLIQLPIYFRFPYTKAKLITIVPIAVCVAVTFVFINIMKETSISSGLSHVLNRFFGDEPIFLCTMVAFLVICAVVSYNLSKAAYRKREF